MAMEGDWVAGPGSACACARDPADSMVKHTAAQSATIASGKEDRALFWHRGNGIRLCFGLSAALTPPPPSSVAPGKARFRVSGMISPMEAISLTKDLPIDGGSRKSGRSWAKQYPFA